MLLDEGWGHSCRLKTGELAARVVLENLIICMCAWHDLLIAGGYVSSRVFQRERVVAVAAAAGCTLAAQSCRASTRAYCGAPLTLSVIEISTYQPTSI